MTGTAEKFQEIYCRYANLILNRAYEITGDYHAAQDICQDTFERLYGYQEKLDESGVAGWLYVVSSNLALDHRKKSSSRREVLGTDRESPGILDSGSRGIFESVELYCFCKNILRGLWQKNEKWFEVLTLVGLLGIPRRDIARKMGVSLSTVDQYLRNGRKWLRENFREDYDALRSG